MTERAVKDAEATGKSKGETTKNAKHTKEKRGTGRRSRADFPNGAVSVVSVACSCFSRLSCLSWFS